MRTTLTLDDDVLDRTRAVARKLRSPFRRVVNEAIRAGLEHMEKPAPARAYRTQPHRLGLRAGRNLTNVHELLAQVEGEDHA